MVAGSVDALIANPDGIVLGDALVRKLSLALGENVTVPLRPARSTPSKFSASSTPVAPITTTRRPSPI
jgi:lipoprotein-releasing system permease protein